MIVLCGRCVHRERERKAGETAGRLGRISRQYCTVPDPSLLLRAAHTVRNGKSVHRYCTVHSTVPVEVSEGRVVTVRSSTLHIVVVWGETED